MNIDTVNWLLSIVAMTGNVAMLGYSLIKTDWKQEREFARLMQQMHHTYAPRRKATQRHNKAKSEL